jgi:hypothetical protein
MCRRLRHLHTSVDRSGWRLYLRDRGISFKFTRSFSSEDLSPPSEHQLLSHSTANRVEIGRPTYALTHFYHQILLLKRSTLQPRPLREMLHGDLQGHEIGSIRHRALLIGSIALYFSDTAACDRVENICSRTAILAAVEVMMRERVYLASDRGIEERKRYCSMSASCSLSGSYCGS